LNLLAELFEFQADYKGSKNNNLLLITASSQKNGVGLVVVIVYLLYFVDLKIFNRLENYD